MCRSTCAVGAFRSGPGRLGGAEQLQQLALAKLGDRGTENQLRQFAAEGLDGLEVRHPSHSTETEKRLQRIAAKLGLAVTGGSDWHGDTELGEAHTSLGGLHVPAEWLDHLEAVRERYR